MSEQKKKSDPGAIALFILGAVVLAVTLAAAIPKNAPSSPHADQGFARELRLGGGPVEVGDFGTFELREEYGPRLIYRLPAWLEALPYDTRWTLVRLEHRPDLTSPWSSAQGSLIPILFSDYGKQGRPLWLRPDARTPEGYRAAPGEEGLVALASPWGLCPGCGYRTFYVRVAVYDETAQWTHSPTVPVTAHSIRRFGDRR